eukprot:TRINITY_DN3520_c0_g1_i3.p1 TRINITY_DN3520_c0_g1~~TRINITY_DN3520_c0_g1_i3.p1  ORF type:complete len:556 (-),score=127.89 TRINITY_DN3520_c0_g1_i3:132-1799(-)
MESGRTLRSFSTSLIKSTWTKRLNTTPMFPFGTTSKGIFLNNTLHLHHSTLTSLPVSVHKTHIDENHLKLKFFRQNRFLFSTEISKPTPSVREDGVVSSKGEEHQKDDQKQQQQNQQKSDKDEDKSLRLRAKEFFTKYTVDELWAIFSVFTVGTTSLLIFFTTTIVAAILWLANTFEMEEFLAKKVSKSLSEMTGMEIKYESATGTSMWKEGSIRLNKVTVHRPPPIGKENHCVIDLTAEEVEVVLSVLRMLEGKGIVKEAKLRGVRGVIDRRTEYHDPNWKPSRRVWHRGDFELTRLDIEDLLLTLHMPDPQQRPFSLSIFSADCNLLRKQWLLYDIFSANSIIGAFDGCLFKYGPAQRYRRRADSENKREMNLKIDGLNMDILSKNASGPLGWIKEGTLDVNLNILLPHAEQEGYFHTVYYPHHGNDHRLSVEDDPSHETSHDADAMEMKFKTRLNHIHLEPPMYSPQISYLNNALIHPISSYMNAHSKHIMLYFEFDAHKADWNGAWTPGAAGLWNQISESVYYSILDAIAEQQRETDFKKVMQYIYTYFFG